MEEKKLKILFGKNGTGHITTKITLPYTWLKKWGLTQENREVNVIFTQDEIIIKKIKD